MLKTGKMLELKISDFSKAKLNFSCSYKQAGAELCQAHGKLRLLVLCLEY